MRITIKIGPGVFVEANLVFLGHTVYFKYDGDPKEEWRRFEQLPSRIQDQIIQKVWTTNTQEGHRGRA